MVEISSTADQMLELLEMVAKGGPLTTAELAQRCGINRTVAHRLMTTLHQRGYVAREGKAFTLGPRIAALAATFDQLDISALAQPAMQALCEAARETVVLHRIDGNDAIVVAQAVPQEQLVRVQHHEGSRHPLTLGASGRALLAFQPAPTVARITASSDDAGALREKLDAIRQSGIAHSENELQRGVIGMAVPLRDADGRVRFALALLAPQQRHAGFRALAALLTRAGREIEAAIGARGKAATRRE